MISRKVSALKGDIEAVIGLPGGELLKSRKTEFELARKQLYGLLVDNKPYSVCGMCHGDKKKAKDCKACKGRGWLSEPVYRSLPDASKKGGKNAPQALSTASG